MLRQARQVFGPARDDGFAIDAPCVQLVGDPQVGQVRRPASELIIAVKDENKTCILHHFQLVYQRRLAQHFQ